MNSSTRKVSLLYDQTLSENNCMQTNNSLQPTVCTKANKINKRYYLEFNGSQRMISNNYLNPQSGIADIVNIFIVYKLNSFSGSNWVRNGFFGHDNGGYDKAVYFSPAGELMIAGTTNNLIVIGPNNVTKYDGAILTPIADYQTKANAGELNKWCCLSIHWSVPGGNNASSVWCNDKKTSQF